MFGVPAIVQYDCNAETATQISVSETRGQAVRRRRAQPRGQHRATIERKGVQLCTVQTDIVLVGCGNSAPQEIMQINRLPSFMSRLYGKRQSQTKTIFHPHYCSMQQRIRIHYKWCEREQLNKHYPCYEQATRL